MSTLLTIDKKKTLYLLTFDDFEPLYVTEDTLVTFMLTKGKNITETDYQAISDFANFSRGQALAMQFISFKPRTRHETAQKLFDKEIPRHYHEPILDKLESLGLLNDQDYAERFVKEKIASHSLGPSAILQKLIQKGLDQELSDQTLANVYDSDTQRLVAQHMAQKYLKSKQKRLSYQILQQKLIQHLASKGFSFELAHEVIEALDLERDDMQEQDLLEQAADKVIRRFQHRYSGYDLKKRCFAALARQGFDFDDINQVLARFLD